MRVLVLIPIPLYGNTGASVNERQLLEALSKKVNEIIIFSLYHLPRVNKSKKQFLPKNVTLIKLPCLPYFGIIAQVFYSILLSAIVFIMDRIWSFDLIYIRGSFLAYGLMLSKRLRTKSIVKIVVIFEDEFQKKGLIRSLIKKIAFYSDRLVLTKAGKIAVIGKYLYKELIRSRRVKRDDEPVEIPPGINLSLMEEVKKQGCEKTSRETFDVGFIGSLYWWQGVDILAQAMGLVSKKIPNVKLIIIGDGESKHKVERTCKKLGIAYEITGFLPHKEALRRLNMLDVMVLPSLRTPSAGSRIPIKIIEAWALGVPVIVTRHKVFSNGYKDCEDVFFCEPSPRDVAYAIFRLLKNRDLRLILAKHGPELAKKFVYNDIVNRLLNAGNISSHKGELGGVLSRISHG